MSPGDYPRVLCPQGNVKSPVTLLLPPPTQELASKGLLLSQKQRSLLEALMHKAGLKYPDDFLVTPVAMCGMETISKRVIDNCDQFVGPRYNTPETQLVVGVGRPIAKFLFGRGGKVPSSDTIFGKPMKQFDRKGVVLFFVPSPVEMLRQDSVEAVQHAVKVGVAHYKKLGDYMRKEGLLCRSSA